MYLSRVGKTKGLALRNVRIFKDVINGMTYREAAGKYGMTRERCRQVVYKVRRAVCHPNIMSPIIGEDGELGGNKTKDFREYKDIYIKAVDSLK